MMDPFTLTGSYVRLEPLSEGHVELIERTVASARPSKDILRNYQPGQGELGTGSPRNTAMFSIIATEWPAVKANLTRRLSAPESL